MRGVVWFSVLLFVVSGVCAFGEEPPLPEGLGDTQEESAEPALPEGLGGEEDGGEEPALPEGLGGGEQDEAAAETAEEEDKPGWRERIPLDLHGFWETRAGTRTQQDPAYSKWGSIGETRLQLETEKAWDKAIFEFTGDLYTDAVTEEVCGDLRQARLTLRVGERFDIRAGRQVLTWGTGDQLFINDTFPKDWQAFFIGRDTEYLKAPSDAVKAGFYSDAVNIEFVFTPQFAHDRFIRGERVSYYQPMFNTFWGDDHWVDYNAPNEWFEDDEFNLRIYKRIGGNEFALYGYSGYWKSPGGQRLVPFMQASFPKLNVYGASFRGMLGKGVFNAEVGYYDSRQDRDGGNLLINNSEFRVLLGYERELAKNFTAGAQWYLEHMMDYNEYMRTRLPWIPARDQDRHVFTLRLTKLAMNQNLTLSWFMYYSPTDGDAYMRPNVHYKITDAWAAEIGGNIFMGESDSSFFGQFKHNTNVYVGVRYGF